MSVSATNDRSSSRGVDRPEDCDSLVGSATGTAPDPLATSKATLGAGEFQRQRGTTTLADATNATMTPGSGLSALDVRLGRDGLIAKGTGTARAPSGRAATGADGVFGTTSVKTAKATAALKSLLGNTSIDTVGSDVVITNNRLTQAQFQAAIATVFGDDARVSGNGTFTWTKKSSVDAKLVAAYQGIVDGVQVSAQGALALRKGAAAADVDARLKTLIGQGVLVADGEVVFADTKWQSAQLNDEITQQLGPSASLDAVVKSTIDANGVKSAVATAALKALLGNTTLDTRRAGFAIVNNKLTQEQFAVAIATVFGDGAQVNANGSFTWTKGTGVDAGLFAAYRGVADGLKSGADSTLTLAKGAVAGDVEVNLQRIVGDGALIADAKVVFADEQWQSIELMEEVKQKFGDAGSLDATFNATADRSSVRTVSATAAVKALLGGTSIDTAGASVTITNHRLTQAQFAAAIATVFGDGAQVSANGTFTWTKDGGIDASLVASYQGVVAGIDVAAGGHLLLKDGAVAGDVTANLRKVVGDGVLVSKNEIVFENSRIARADLDQQVQESFGKDASLAATFQATIDHAGIETMTATAAFKALLGGNTTIETDSAGLTIVNNKLTGAQFESAIKTVFPNAELAANGSFKWDKTSGVDASVIAAFKGTVRGVDVDTSGQLTLKDGAFSGEVEAHAKALLGSTVVVSDDKLVFANSRLASTELEHEVVQTFGPSASLAATVRATIDHEGIASATATAAFKAVLGNVKIDTGGTGFTITRGQLTQAQFQAAVTTLFGPNATVSSSGRFTWNKDSGVDASLASSFIGLVRNFAVKGDGTLALKNGKVQGDVDADVERVLGSNTIVANGKLVFGDGAFQSVSVGAEIAKQFGPTASLEATFAASIDAQGKAEASLKIAAFKRLKQLGDGGEIDFKPDGSVVIKDGKIDRAEVGALVSVVAGKDVNLDTSGRLICADGKVDSQFSANLASTWNNTRVDAQGTLSITDGKPTLEESASAVFGDNASFGVGGKVGVDGVSEASLNFKLAKLFGSNIDASGSLQLSKGQLQAGLTTNLLVGGDDATKIGLGGVVAFTDKKKAAQLKAQIDAGVASGGFSISTQATSEVYEPGLDDPVRAAITQSGAAWSIRDVQYAASANAGADFTIMAGPVPLQLGFTASGSTARDARVLCLHPTAADAEAEHAVFSLRMPQTVDEVLAMKPYEQVSESGSQAIGFSGHVAVGSGEGPATASIGGEVYCQLTGNTSRDIERLEGDRVRVRFRREEGESNTRAVSLSVGVKTPKITGNDIVDKAAAPIVEQLAQLGLKQSWERMSERDAAFDVTIDAGTPEGREALAHLLKNDLSEAQYLARCPASGVVLNSDAVSYVSAKTHKLDVDLATLNAEDMARWLDRQQKTLTDDSFTITDARDFKVDHDAFWPWNPNTSADVRLLHETSLPALDAPNFAFESAAAATEIMRVRVPPPEAQARSATVDDTRALLGVRMTIANPKTSLKDMQRELGPGLEIMRMLGFNDDETHPLARLNDAIGKGASPNKRAIFGGLGDQRFGATAMAVEGYVSPSGLKNLIGCHPPHTRDDFAIAFLDAQGTVRDPTLFSKAGILANIAATLDCIVERNETGGFALKQAGTLIGRLSDHDLAALQSALLVAPTAADVRMPANVGTFFGARPKELVHVDGSTFRAATDARDHAFAFADSLMKASTLFIANEMPAQKSGESDADYAKRVDGFKRNSLYEKPEEFWARINDWMQSALKADKDPLVGPLALLALAGEPSIYGRIELDLPKETGAAMIEAGRKEVQKFGGFQLLVGMGARIDTRIGSITIAAGSKPDLAEAALKAVFGDRAKLGAARGGRVQIAGAKLDEEQLQKLATLFDFVKLDDGKLRLPGGFEGDVARGALDAISLAAVERDGRIEFDNGAFDFVHVGDALESYFGKGSFGGHDAGHAPP